MKLIIPSVSFRESYLEAVEEGKNEIGITRITAPLENESFEQFTNSLVGHAKGINLPEGYVPNTELWLVDNDTFIGFVNIRHILTEHLLKVGGHIGYWIRPSKRHMGYGKMILKLALAKTKEMGIKKALITCDTTNSSSRKIIEANGGILENIVENGPDNPPKMRYWITIE